MLASPVRSQLVLSGLTIVLSLGLLVQARAGDDLNASPLGDAPLTARLYIDAANFVYRGQLVQLYLEIGLRNSTSPPLGPLRLDIPWLGREFGFRWRLPYEQWFCQHSLPIADGLPCKISIPQSIADRVGLPAGSYVIYIPLHRASPLPTWRLTWQLILDKPVLGNQIVFAPVSLGIGENQHLVRTAPLSLTVQEPPPALSLRTATILPPGVYRLSARCQPTVTYIGQPVDYVLCLSGSGALEDIDIRQIHQQVTDAFGIPLQFLGETWPDPLTRCLRWRLNLPSAGTWPLPALRFLALKPHDQPPDYQELETASLVVRALPALPPPRVERSLDMPYLPLRKISARNLYFDAPEAGAWKWVLLWLIPPGIWLLFAGWRWYRGQLLVWHRYSLAARQVFGLIKRHGRIGDLDAYTLWHLVQDYLQHRIGSPPGASAQEIASLLEKLGLDSATHARFVRLLSQLEKAAFSPEGTKHSPQASEIMAFIAQVDRQPATAPPNSTQLAS